jgi:hypothetical protein
VVISCTKRSAPRTFIEGEMLRAKLLFVDQQEMPSPKPTVVLNWFVELQRLMKGQR